MSLSPRTWLFCLFISCTILVFADFAFIQCKSIVSAFLNFLWHCKNSCVWNTEFVDSAAADEDFPTSLTALDVGGLTKPFSHFLPNLLSLTLSSRIQQVYEAQTIPLTLTELRNYAQMSKPGELPLTLFHLHYHQDFTDEQKFQMGILPRALRILQRSPHFNQPLTTGMLNHGLTALHLGEFFNRPLSVGVLPPTLTTLHLPISYRQPLLPSVLPAALRR